MNRRNLIGRATCGREITCNIGLRRFATHCVATTWLATATAADTPTHVGTGFNALISHRSESSGELIQRARMNLTTDGIRISKDASGTGLEYLHEFSNQAIWLIDHALEQYHHILLNTSREPTLFDTTWQGITANLSTTTPPCSNAYGVTRGIDHWQAMRVEIWDCESRDGSTFSQLYSAEWGVVVRTPVAEGVVMEITDIKPAMMPAGIAPPPHSYRSVDIQTLLDGNRKLPAFSPTVQQGHFEPDHVKVVKEDTKQE